MTEAEQLARTLQQRFQTVATRILCSPYINCPRYHLQSGYQVSRPTAPLGLVKDRRDGLTPKSDEQHSLARRQPPFCYARTVKSKALPAVHVATTTSPAASFAIPFTSLLLSAMMPILKVAMLCSVGALSSRKGWLTVDGRRVLSQLVFNVFTPCLFFGKLAAAVSLADAVRLWPLTTNILLSHVIGIALGLLMIRLASVPAYLHPHVMLANAVGNVGNLPLLLVASLATDPRLPFLSSLPFPSDLAVQYVILSNFSAAFIQFPLSIFLLRQQQMNSASSATSNTSSTFSNTNGASSQDSIRSTIQDTANVLHHQQQAATQSDVGGAEGLQLQGQQLVQAHSTEQAGATCRQTQASYVHLAEQQVPGSSVVLQHSSQSVSSDLVDHQVSAHRPHPSSPNHSINHQMHPHPHQQQEQHHASQTSKASIPEGNSASSQTYDAPTKASQQPWGLNAHVLQPLLQGVLSLPTIACFLALIVGSIPLLRDALFTRTGSLHAVGDVINMFGDMTIPSLMLVLGANLANGPGIAGTPARIIISTAISRLLLMPLAGALLVLPPYLMGWFGPMDPLALLVMLVMHSSPTALMVHNFATLFRNREDDVSAMLFWQYLMSMLTLPMCIAAYLFVLGQIA